MKHPGFLTAIAGNGFVFAGSSLLFIAMLIAYLQGAASGVAVLGSMALAGVTGKAHSQMRDYQLWRMEWESMGGEPARQFRLRIPGLKYVVGGIAWLFLASGAGELAKQPGNGLAVTLFWLGSLIGALRLVYLLFRHLGVFTAVRPKARAGAVAVCLAPPKQSPTLQEAYAALPPHCRELVGQ